MLTKAAIEDLEMDQSAAAVAAMEADPTDSTEAKVCYCCCCCCGYSYYWKDGFRCGRIVLGGRRWEVGGGADMAAMEAAEPTDSTEAKAF